MAVDSRGQEFRVGDVFVAGAHSGHLRIRRVIRIDEEGNVYTTNPKGSSPDRIYRILQSFSNTQIIVDRMPESYEDPVGDLSMDDFDSLSRHAGTLSPRDVLGRRYKEGDEIVMVTGKYSEKMTTRFVGGIKKNCIWVIGANSGNLHKVDNAEYYAIINKKVVDT